MDVHFLKHTSNAKIKSGLFLILIFFTLILSCSKQTDSKTRSLILTGIKSAKGSEMVSIKIDSGVINTTPVSCYIMSSSVMDPTTGGYGYVDCDTLFRIINPLSGEEIRSFKVPWGLSHTVITGNWLIGRYTAITYEEGTGAPIYTNHILTLDIESGTQIAENQVDLGDGVWACSYYYDSDNDGYVLFPADNTLISINPLTGEIFNTVNIGKPVGNVVFDNEGRRIIGLTYSFETDRNYVEVYDPETGNQISSKEITQRDNYYACVSGYDAGSNSYMLVNTNNEVLFIDISTGAISKSYKLDDQMNDIKFWNR